MLTLPKYFYKVVVFIKNIGLLNSLKKRNRILYIYNKNIKYSMLVNIN